MLKEEMKFYEKDKAKDMEIETNNKITNAIFWFFMAIVFMAVLTIIIVYL